MTLIHTPSRPTASARVAFSGSLGTGSIGARQVLAGIVSTPAFVKAMQRFNAGWSSPVARQAHNLKVIGSNPIPATNYNAKPRPRGRGFRFGATGQVSRARDARRMTNQRRVASPLDIPDRKPSVFLVTTLYRNRHNRFIAAASLHDDRPNVVRVRILQMNESD
jgi:hypothetical protein